jgi:hypothetical protein
MHTRLLQCLQALIVLLGLAVMTFMLWEPHVEGRNANATVFEIYFQDPFLAYVYLGSSPFFVALAHLFSLLRQLAGSLPSSVEARRSAITQRLGRFNRCIQWLMGFIALGMVFIALWGDPEDHPAGLAMGLGLLLIATSMLLCSHYLLRRQSLSSH